MNKRVKRIVALVILGMIVLIMCAPTPSALVWGGHLTGASNYMVIDSDNNSNDEVWAVFHDGSPVESPPGEELFRIQENGRVGILNPDPTHTLDVNGSVRVRELPQDDSLDNLVVADADGVLHVRDVNTIAGGTPNSWYGVDTGAPPSDINDDIYTNGEVGIGTDAPATTLDVNGGFATNIVTVTEVYTASGSDYTILADASTKSVRVKLPSAGEVPGQILNIKRIDDHKKNKVVIDGNVQEKIDGQLTVQLNTKYMSYTIQSDGSGWYIITSYGSFGQSHLNNKNR
ncbi:MAG: hypothetical protein JSV56_04280 [Methanomassiliicoccales archaeon]|nr:MAG: hypothetical protein JSV56_04280 [Methanomassiliicoccales archaeon]